MDHISASDLTSHDSIQKTAKAGDQICDSDTSDDWGDFVDSDDEGDVEFVCEDINLYPRGICYPLSIGEIVADRYRIIHKLGHGSFSTVWMAHDMIDKTDVAPKVLMIGNSEDHEYNIQSEIIGAVKDLTYLLVYRTSFALQSPHGQHRVMVFPMQGPNLRNYPPKNKPLATRFSFPVQLLQALKALHEAEIVHADLNTANIMYTLRPLEKGDTSAKYRVIGRPRKRSLWTEQWKEGELVMPMKPDEDLLGDTVVLGDFGLAHKAGAPTQKMQSPATYCAPERVHNTSPSYGSDIWSYMCIFFELYTGAYLFQGWGHASVVSSIVHKLGPLPVSWKGTYHVGGSGEDKWYDQNWQTDPEFDLKVRLAQLRPDITAEERELIVSFLSRGLSFQHENRLTAAQLLQDDALKRLREIHGV
ncbi:CMGC protein kinase [Fusarium bulbicola]|nr:CMGC protein kinase [Fusarium bulbicola]